ncbi:hypothetical protein RY26_18000 [Pseudomonas fluorescens]|jgi:hypothetical protein|nr:hypothetical protein RY26_18000 [Pseudomonas fluorescens]
MSFQVGGFLEYPPIGPLSLGERARVRGRPRRLVLYIDLKYRVDHGLLKAVLDSAMSFQVDGFLQYPPIGPLSLRERARVRGFCFIIAP